MATQRIGYFISGTTPTEAEAADIEWLTQANQPPYTHAVRSVLHNTGYGSTETDLHTTPEAFDLVSSNGAEIPDAYADIEVFPIPVTAPQKKKTEPAHPAGNAKPVAPATGVRHDAPHTRK